MYHKKEVKEMKEYKSFVCVGDDLPYGVAKIMYNYSDYTIIYSDDNSTVIIGNIYLSKKYGKNREAATLNCNLGYLKKYNEYHIGVVGQPESNMIVVLSENPMLFWLITNLDKHCFKEYKHRNNPIKKIFRKISDSVSEPDKTEMLKEDKNREKNKTRFLEDIVGGSLPSCGRYICSDGQGR